MKLINLSKKLDKDTNFVVIELKAGMARAPVISQILSYMACVRKDLAKDKNVRGIIVANDFEDKIKFAVSELPQVELKKYIVNFEFESVE